MDHFYLEFGTENTFVKPAICKLKDSTMAAFILSLCHLERQQTLKHVHLAHLKIGSKDNTQALFKFIFNMATSLESVYLEGLFMKEKFISVGLTEMKNMKSQETLKEFTFSHVAMKQQQSFQIASIFQTGFPQLQTLVLQQGREIKDPQLIDLVQQYGRAGNTNFTIDKYKVREI